MVPQCIKTVNFKYENELAQRCLNAQKQLIVDTKMWLNKGASMYKTANFRYQNVVAQKCLNKQKQLIMDMKTRLHESASIYKNS